jgi:hypothetical protein
MRLFEALSGPNNKASECIRGEVLVIFQYGLVFARSEVRPRVLGKEPIEQRLRRLNCHRMDLKLGEIACGGTFWVISTEHAQNQAVRRPLMTLNNNLTIISNNKIFYKIRIIT